MIAFRDLPFGEMGSRRVVCDESDGSVSEAVQWYPDIRGYPHESDLIGKTRAAPLSHVRPDRDWLRS